MNQTHDTSPGALFDGRYRIIGRLGQGGMARVFLAEDESLHRNVAVKVLADRYSDDPHFIERFQREARSAARLNHSNIVQVYDHAQTDGVSYIVQEFVDGETLKELIRREGPLESKRAIGFALQILAALRVAHQEGVIHRDVKPQNILVQADGKAKVADFGIARAGETEMTEAGSIVGTAQYLAPEQARGLPVGPPADLYAVGIVLYEMLSGRVPFEGEAAVTVAMRQVQEAPEPLSDRNPLVSSDLEAVVMRALTKNPAHRYQSADEMGAELDRVRQGMAVSEETTLVSAATIATPRRRAPENTETMVAPPPPPRSGPPRNAGPAHYHGNPNRRRLWVLLAVLGVIAVAILGGIFALGGGGEDGGQPLITTGLSVSIPSVVGMQQAEATSTLEQAGFVVRVVPVAAADVPIGQVMAQRPGAGESAPSGSTIELDVSQGPNALAVPDVTGLSTAEARAKLEAANLIVRVTEQASDTVEAGRVISQSPSGGIEAKPGTTVELTVSTGTAQGTVPNVVGMDVTNAENTLIASGLTLGSKTETAGPEPAGQVVSQDPPSGSAAAAGAAVNVVVSSGPATAPVPSVLNLSRGDAEAAISDAGFTADTQEQSVGDPAQDGIVISQNPAGDSKRPQGSTVSIVIGRYTGSAT